MKRLTTTILSCLFVGLVCFGHTGCTGETSTPDADSAAPTEEETNTNADGSGTKDETSDSGGSDTR